MLMFTRGVFMGIAVFLVSQSASAVTVWDFSWMGDGYSAEGTLLLSDDVGIGESFNISDVISFEFEMFDGAVLVAMGETPFPGFGLIQGTRNEFSLNINDFVFSGNGIFYGCDVGDCFSVTVRFGPTSQISVIVDFTTQAAARASFVFVVPEPSPSLSFALALACIACLRSAKHRF